MLGLDKSLVSKHTSIIRLADYYTNNKIIRNGPVYNRKEI